MSSDFSGIGSDGAGYIVTPQETVRRDVPLLAALEQAPQSDPLVRREEQQTGQEMSRALHELKTQQDDRQLSQDEMIDQLAQSMMGGGYSPEAGYGGASDSPFAGGYAGLNNSAEESSAFGNLQGLFNNAQSVMDESNRNFGGGHDGSGLGNGLGSYGGGYGNNFNSGFQNGYGAGFERGFLGAAEERYAAQQNSGANGQRWDQPFNGLYDGGRGDDGRYSNHSYKNTTAAQSGSEYQLNSDGTVTSPNGSQTYSGTHNDQNHPDFLHLATKDYPGGFALNSESKNGDTRSINGEVDGHKVEVWTDNDGKVKAQLDGKVVDANNNNGDGILQANSDGSFTIKGRNDATGASIDVQVGANNPNGQHHGLTTTVGNINGPDGNDLHLGGFLGDAIKDNAS